MERYLALASVLAVCGCGPYAGARSLEAKGKPAEAAAAYAEAARSRPRADWRDEALWRSGRLWAGLGDCEKARVPFEELARSEGPKREEARAALMACPDYLPAESGRSWDSGDSSSLGRNMRQPTRVLAPEDGTAVLETRIYAGKKLYATRKRKLRKAEWKVEESSEGGEATVLLRYPYRKGESWSSRRGERLVSFKIEETGAEVKVRAGTFKDCLKVREQVEGLPSWTYVYYAPGVGPVLTTVAGKGFENRSAELLSWAAPKETP